MPADPRPVLIGFMPEPEQQRRLVRESIEARPADAQRRALSPPTPIDRPAIRSVSAVYQSSFASFHGG